MIDRSWPGALTTEEVSELRDILHWDDALSFAEVQLRLLANGMVKYRPIKTGGGYLATDPSGNLYACYRYVGSQANVLGQVTDYVWPPRPAPIRENRNNRDCEACWARRICGGECHAVLNEIGEDLIRKQSFCVLRRAIFNCALRSYVRVKLQAPDLLEELASAANTKKLRGASTSPRHSSGS